MFEIAGAAWDLLKHAAFRAYWLLRTWFRWLAAKLRATPERYSPVPAEEAFSRALERRAIQHAHIVLIFAEN